MCVCVCVCIYIQGSAGVDTLEYLTTFSLASGLAAVYTQLSSWALRAKLLQLCLTLCDPMDSSPQGPSVHEDLPVKNTKVDCHALFWGIFLTLGSNPCFLSLRRWQVGSLPLAAPGKLSLQVCKIPYDTRWNLTWVERQVQWLDVLHSLSRNPPETIQFKKIAALKSAWHRESHTRGPTRYSYILI